MNEKSAYAQAGVDIAAGHKATQLMKTAVQATFGPEVLSDVGSFGGLYDVSAFKNMAHPILVASTDGVGTKTKVAAKLGRWDTIGYDIVNHCVNDILVQGARPLFFLDYVASSKLNPEQIATIVRGIAEACQPVGCALLGGETAEMPGVYEFGEIDLVGTVVGVLDRAQLIDGSRIKAGDVILALPSSGLHTNGFTLARKALAAFDWSAHNELLGTTIGEALLVPHRVYLREVQALRSAGVDIRGLSHITGGGLIDNPPRIFPEGLGAILQKSYWAVPPIFQMIQRAGNVSDADMAHAFNMGLGMLLIVPREDVPKAETAVGPELIVVGEMAAGMEGVVIE